MTTPEQVEAQPVEQADTEVMQEATTLARHPDHGEGNILSLIREGLTSKADVAVMRELLAIRREERADQAAEAFAAALVQFRTMVKPIIMTGLRDDTKTANSRGEMGTVRYPYAELTTTIEQIQSALDQCQLTPTWRMLKSEPAYVEIECIVTHILKHKESSGPFGSPVGEGRRGQTPVQVRTGVITSLKRVTLFMVLGLTTKEDDAHLREAEQGQEPPKPQPPADPEADTKKAFWNACQQKAGVKFTAAQVRTIFAKVQEASGKTAAVDCLKWLSDPSVLVGKDGSLAVETDPEPTGDPFADQTPAAASGRPTPAPSPEPAPQPPSSDAAFECDECLTRYQVKPARAQCTHKKADGSRCMGQVVAIMQKE